MAPVLALKGNLKGAIIRCERALQIEPEYQRARELLPQLQGMLAATRAATQAATTQSTRPSTTRSAK